MWFPRRRATISSGRSTRRRIVFSAHAVTSVRTWRMSTWSRGTWITWVESTSNNSSRLYLKSGTWPALSRTIRHSNGRFPSSSRLFSPGSSSQRRTPMTAWPSHYRGRPPSWRRHCLRHRRPSPKSLQTTWIWGCRWLRMLMAKFRGRALLWWGSGIFLGSSFFFFPLRPNLNLVLINFQFGSLSNSNDSCD